MALRNEIKQLWMESFDDTAAWTDTFFSNVYNDNHALVLRGNGVVVSSLLLQPYSMSFHGSQASIGYICGASTRRDRRGQGLMSRLMHQTLREAHARGQIFTALIPANNQLYDFYRRFGFVTAFYTQIDSYPPNHDYATQGHYHALTDPLAPEVYTAFNKLESTMKCRVMHSSRNYINVIDDNRLDGGHVAVMADHRHEIASIALAVERNECVIVTEVLGRDADSITAALHHIHSHWPDLPLKVMSPPDSIGFAPLTPRGMIRVANATECLRIAAAANPQWSCCIKISDPIVKPNNTTLSIDSGKVINTNTQPHLTLTISDLTHALFVGSSSDIPSSRPFISLMLD